MCGLYYQSSACLYYQGFLSRCTVICPCIALPFTSTLGGGEIKVYLIIFQPNLAHNLGLLGIIGVYYNNPARIYEPVTYI